MTDTGYRRQVKRPPLARERWATLEPLIDAAIEMPPAERRAFLVGACGGDDELCADAERLLAQYDRRDSLFDAPAAERFGALFDAGSAHLPAVLAGRYRVDRELGRGGMATVFLAWDLRHERNVAIKVIHPHFAATLGVERFLTEIKTTARLHDPHILALHDSGEADGCVFYVMPYVDGGSLRRRLAAEKHLPLEEAVRIACDVAAGLAAAHRDGIIHRDIKPENILLHNGAAVVADFGIAVAVSAAAPSRMTQPGSYLGTPEYMSPEQATGDGIVDARSDVYALGTVLYEMLAGEPPFTGATATAVVAKRAAIVPPSVRILRPAIPASVDAVIGRALSREPADRYATAEQFATSLRHALESSADDSVGSRPHVAGDVRTSVRRSWAFAAVVAVTLLLIVGARAWRRTHSSAAPDRNNIVVVPFRVTGPDSSFNYLSEGLAVLLAHMMGDGRPLALESRSVINAWNRINAERANPADRARAVAREMHAGTALLGTALIASGQLTLTADLVNTEGGESHALTSVHGSADSLPTLLDELLRQLLVRHAGVTERTVGELTSQSLPALRAYLDGRAAYRRGHRAEAIQSFQRALDADSTFALAALDLAIATNRLIRQLQCTNAVCTSASMVTGFRDVGSAADDEPFDRGVRLAWNSRAKLGPRDLPMLEALRTGQVTPGDAKETFDALERASAAAPDRADTKYLLGFLLSTEGYAFGYSDAIVRAEGFFREAYSLDSAYLAPLARLVDVAAYENDESKLRRIGLQYLARDSVGAAADYVRWRVAIGTRDAQMIRAIHARFDSLDLTTLKQIVTASQMSGIALDDADRAAKLVIDRATSPVEREAALYFGHQLALNRGRPRAADSLSRLRTENGAVPAAIWRSSTLAALFGDGDSASGEQNARERDGWLARDTLTGSVLTAAEVGDVWQQAVWDWHHGQMKKAKAITDWIRRYLANQPAFRLWRADVTDMLLATSAARSDAAALRARVDSEARHGCCRTPRFIHRSLALAYELAGNDSAALSVLRRERAGTPGFLSTVLLEEGRLAARLGDRDGAIRALDHYLVLRSDPEPVLVPQRDSVRAALRALRNRTLIDRMTHWLRRR